MGKNKKPIMNTRYLVLTLSLMLLGIGALPQNVAEPSAERQDEAPPGAEDLAKPEVADAVDAERQDDIGEAPLCLLVLKTLLRLKMMKKCLKRMKKLKIQTQLMKNSMSETGWMTMKNLKRTKILNGMKQKMMKMNPRMNLLRIKRKKLLLQLLKKIPRKPVINWKKQLLL